MGTGSAQFMQNLQRVERNTLGLGLSFMAREGRD